jgi:hypothetical protein
MKAPRWNELGCREWPIRESEIVHHHVIESRDDSGETSYSLEAEIAVTLANGRTLRTVAAIEVYPE